MYTKVTMLKNISVSSHFQSRHRDAGSSSGGGGSSGDGNGALRHETIVMSHVDGPCDFWAQDSTETNISAGKRIIECLSAACPTAPALTGLPEFNRVYAAVFSEDMNWYRCTLVEKVSSTQVGMKLFRSVQYCESWNFHLMKIITVLMHLANPKMRPLEWTSRECLSHIFAFYSFSLTFSSVYCTYFCSLVPCGSIDIIFKCTTFLVLLSTFFCVVGDNKGIGDAACWLFEQCSVSLPPKLYWSFQNCRGTVPNWWTLILISCRVLFIVYPTMQVLLLSTHFILANALAYMTLGFVSTALPKPRYAITKIPL